MDCVKYITQQHKTQTEQIQAQDNIGLVSSCIDFIDELAIRAEEEYWKEQPITTNTLRFYFIDADYNPNGLIGTLGTWTKRDSKKLNIWDWTREDSDWTKVFGNETVTNGGAVYVPAVTSLTEVYKTHIELKPAQVPYSIQVKFKILAADFSNVTNMTKAFQYAVGMLELPDTLDFTRVTTLERAFFACHGLKSFPNLYAPLCTSCLRMCNTNGYVETIGDIIAPNSTDFRYAFMNHTNLKTVGIIDLTSCTNIRDLFEYDYNLTHIKELKNTQNIQTWHDPFGACISLEKIQDLDLTGAVDLGAFLGWCCSLKEVPNFTIGENFNGSVRAFFCCCTKLEDIPDNEVWHRATNFESFLSADDFFFNNRFTNPLMDMKLKKLPDWKPENITNADYMFYGLKHVSKESVEEWFNFLKNSPTLVSHVGTFRECAHNENLPDDWK